MSEVRNRLAAETSPYLLQHSTNPVDWYAWGPEALERARREDKPIFLSIGYAACHWCHVMERESFENQGLADFLNRYFVSIKVDREERPDLDDIYMAATVALSGSGGWPMSVFLTPDQQPFFAGTYFPPSDRYGRPGFPTLLQRLVELWQNERDAVFQQAAELTRHVRQASASASAEPIPKERLEQASAEFARSFDPRFGGFGSAPKFPPHQGLRLLLRDHGRNANAKALEMVTATLDGMKNGGIYDHVAGGFSRYSTDERWLVPHFEKMLYDNAQLAVVYLEAFQVTSDGEYRRVASETLDYVAREMQSPEGGYYSATDADSEGEEGKFFVFRPDELDDVLEGEEKEAFCLYYDVSPGGNWEGKNVLNTPRPMHRVAQELGLSSERLREHLARAKDKVYAARLERVPPLLDDKVLTAWNGLMIEAMTEGYRVLEDPRYLESAERAARFVMENLSRPDGGLYRTTRKGKSHISGFLEDYAYLADALVSLYEVSGQQNWLDEALRLAERLIQDFGSDGGGFHQTAESHEPLIARVREGHDGALPNPNAVAARALTRLSYHLDREDLRARASDAIVAYGALIERSPRAFASALCVSELLLQGPTELVLVGARESEDSRALATALAAHYLPNRVLARVHPELPSDTPLTRGKTLVNQRAALYVCRNFTCQAPITSPKDIGSALEADRRAREPLAALRPEDPRGA